jgi:hypothetical protein
LGRGLRLAENKAHLIVLDFIGNYRRAQFKLPFLVGLEDDEVSNLQGAARLLTLGERSSDLPPGISVSLDPVALEHLKNAIDRPANLRQQLIEEFRELSENLGHRPDLLELERRGRHSARQYCRSFGSWHGALRACSSLSKSEEILEVEVGTFLKELERTVMVQSYKMVVIEAMLAKKKLGSSISIDDIAVHFRAHFIKERFKNEILDKKIADIAMVPAAVLKSYILENPINAWVGGNTQTRTGYFRYDRVTSEFAYIGPKATDEELFSIAVANRVAWRLETHLSRPGPGRTVYKVIPNGGGACIMLGSPSGDGLPRGEGWQVVRMNGRLLYAKFAKIAINWMAEAPDGENILTSELTQLLGSDLLRFAFPYRVLLSRESDSRVYSITAPEDSRMRLPAMGDRPYGDG